MGDPQRSRAAGPLQRAMGGGAGAGGWGGSAPASCLFLRKLAQREAWQGWARRVGGVLRNVAPPHVTTGSAPSLTGKGDFPKAAQQQGPGVPGICHKFLLHSGAVVYTEQSKAQTYQSSLPRDKA